MKTVLVAGGAGFIGCYLCERLLKEDFKVICIDNLITGDKKNIEEFLKEPNFQFVDSDLTVLGLEKPKIPKLNYIFHLASPASPNKKSPRSYINLPIETMLVNSIGTYNLLKLALEDVAKFLFASTSEIYGDPKISPQAENYFGNVNPNGIRSVYDEAKRFGEAITMAFVRKYDLDARVIRIFNTYGPKMKADDGRVVSNFINQAINNKPITVYGTGDQTRSFCYISDMVDGIIKAMFTDKTKGEVINLGNPDEKKVAELAIKIKTMINSYSQIVKEDLPEDDPKERNPDIKKAKVLLNWEPKVGLEEGLEKTIDYFRSIQ